MSSLIPRYLNHMSALISKEPTLLNIEKAKVYVVELKENELDGWNYVVVPISDTMAKIAVYDDQKEFVGYW